MEQFTEASNIQPGQELDPYTVLRLRQAALHEGVKHGQDQDVESEADAEEVTVRKSRK